MEEVKRAIFICAGFGSRMAPVTINTPKALVKVGGVRIIDRLINALLAKGINEIYIVRGYLKEQFDELKEKYTMIKFIDNDKYNVSNNVYSVYLARHLLEDAYILDGDLVLSNPDVISKYHESSDYLAVYKNSTNDWCFTVDEDDNITSINRGGNNCYQKVGISFWNKEDGSRLAKHLEEVLSDDANKDRYWESVPFDVFINQYKVKVKECFTKDIVEIDTYNELCQVDSSYYDFVRPEIELEDEVFENIQNTLGCNREDVTNIEFMKIGLTNISFKFNVKGKNYVYRKPGEGTSNYISRKAEAYSQIVAKESGLDTTLVCIDENKGWKISEFVENNTLLDPYGEEDCRGAMQLVKKLHDANITSDYDYDYMSQIDKFIEIFERDNSVDFSPYYETNNKIREINAKLESLGYKKILCHNDFWYYNILKDENGRLILIDWEYSGNSYPVSDVANYTSSLNYTNDDYMKLAEMYEGHPLSDQEKWYYNAGMAITLWHWFVWALYRESCGKTIDDKTMWYEKAMTALELC